MHTHPRIHADAHRVANAMLPTLHGEACLQQLMRSIRTESEAQGRPAASACYVVRSGRPRASPTRRSVARAWHERARSHLTW